MNAYRPLAIGVAWFAIAFAVHALFAIVTVGGLTPWVALAYAWALGSSFALHRNTRGPLLLAVAFGVSAALLVEGIAFAYAAETASLLRRIAYATALALPVLALVARRWSVDSDDAWFARHAGRLIPAALVLGLSLLIVGITYARKHDATAHIRALAILGCGGRGWSRTEARHDPLWIPTGDDEQRMTTFLSGWSGASAPIRAEVREACGRLVKSAAGSACLCADRFLSSRSVEIQKRRDGFRAIALVSALPLALAALFAWRGRRRQSDT
jgi:hypothetical protein